MAYYEDILASNPTHYFDFFLGGFNNEGSVPLTFGTDLFNSPGLTFNSNDGVASFYGQSGYVTSSSATEGGFSHTDNTSTSLPVNSPATISLWFKIASGQAFPSGDGNTYADSNWGLFNAPVAGNGVRIFVSGTNGQVSVENRTAFGSTTVILNSNTILPQIDYRDGNWHNVVLVMGNPSWFLYVDGALRHSVGGRTGSNIAATSEKKWGQGYDWGSNQWTPGLIGELDECAIFPSALTLATIKSYYYNGKSRLTKQIGSYDPEQYIRLDHTYSLTPLNSGTGGGAAWALSNETPIFVPSSGTHNDGAWRFNFGNGTGDTSPTRYRALGGTHASINPELTDRNFSTGFWFKTNFTLTADVNSAGDARLARIDQQGKVIQPAFFGYVSGQTQNLGKLYINKPSDSSQVFSSSRVDNQQWHYLAYRSQESAGNTSIEVYIDGSLLFTDTFANGTNGAHAYELGSTFGIGSTTYTTVDFSNIYITPYSSIDATAISDIYTQGTYTGTDLTYGVLPFEAYNAELLEPTVTGESVTNITFNADPLTANAESVEPALSLEANLDAFGFDAASAELVMPAIDAIQNLDYAADPQTASADIVHPTVSTEIYVDYAASPATASAYLSSNVYFGQAVQDTSYSLILREIDNTTNINANNGFDIGTQWTSGVITDKQTLAIKANSGFPIHTELVKVKINPAHVTISSTNDVAPLNTFDVYVFTANPSTTFDTMTYGNIPAKEFVFTTRLVDDGSNTQFYLDLTPAFADSRAHTYGVFIEANTSNAISGTQYDRTTFTGTNLQNQLLYVLTTSFVNKNVNADPMTALAENVMPSIYLERFVDYNHTVATASADLIMPAAGTENSLTYYSGSLDASALAVQPAFARTVEYPHEHAEAFAVINNVSVHVTANVDYMATVVTASALFHMPQTNVGENNIADHMNASALFPMPTLLINRIVSASPMIATALSPNAVGGGQILGIINAEPMRANAKSVTPPLYDLLTEDPWFNRLYAQDLLSAEKISFIAFMKEAQLSSAGNLGINSTIADVGYDSSKVATALGSINTALSPTPLAYQGTYDDWARRALRLENISFRWRDPIAGSEASIKTVDRGYTMEAMIKTTKANQILFIGQNGYTFEANPIGLKNGKIFIGSSSANFLQITDARLNSAATLMQATKTNVADGQWHHIVVQFGYDGRHQIWIDGQLELQRYGLKTNNINLIGYNSADANLASDFEISVFSIQIEQFLLEQDVALNYFASIRYTPIEAAPMTASLVAPGATKAKGNRGRALMLYFWSTWSLGSNNYSKGVGFTPTARLERLTSFDQGANGYFDYDTSANLSTWELLNEGVQTWNGWDIFPVDVQGIYASSVVNPSAYKSLITSTFYSGQNPVSWKQAEGFYDATTDNRRYIDLMQDIPDLNDFDMIFFRNYPDQGQELDSFAKFESVDNYFGLQEKVLFDNFLKSLRQAVDTGISLLVTNPQLAIDLGIVDRVEVVPDLDETPSSSSNTYVEQLMESTDGFDGPVNTDPVYADSQYYFADTYKNNKHRVANTITGLSDIPAYIWKETVYYNNDGRLNFSGLDKWWNKYEYKPNGLGVGDEFLISTNNVTKSGVLYQAVPVANIRAGKPFTTFGSNVINNGISVQNPYRNHATSIVVEPGDVLNGTQVGGKIFVSFTETLQPTAIMTHQENMAE